MNQPEEVRRLNAESARFKGEGGTLPQMIDDSGSISGDRDAEVAADARNRRGVPMIPGARVSRKTGASLTYFPPRGTPGWRRKGEIHPRRRTYPVHSAKGPRRPALEDALETVAALLGDRRFQLLRRGLASRGATKEEREARAYLAVLLRYLDATVAQEAAADLLLAGGADARGLRKMRDLRARTYPFAAEVKAEADLRAALGQLAKKKRNLRES